MAERERIHRPVPERRSEAPAETATNAATGDKLKSDIDDLLDEIDEVLETNAEEFIKSYVQKGGQ